MQPPRTAYVHIGVPKTGSTAIQAAFSAARDRLRSEGYHYLAGDRNHGERLALAFWDRPDALHLAGLRWKDGSAAEQYIEATRAELASEIEENSTRHLILCGEDLSGFRPSEVARLHDFLGARFDRVRVVAFLRDPLDWATSASQQATQWSGDTLDMLFDAPRLPGYQTRLGPWIAELGRESMDVLAYDKSDVAAKFARVIGLSRPLPTTGTLRQNAGVSHRSAILFSKFNALTPPFADCRHNPLRSFDLIQDGRLPGRRFQLPRETVETWNEALEAERDWTNHCLGHSAFAPQELPDMPRDQWYGDEREELEAFAEVFAEQGRLAQNERALRMYLNARKHCDNPALAKQFLDKAWLLTTDRWTMDRIGREALEQNRADREKFFAKGRLMRRLEMPEPGDMAPLIGNPFDRPWVKFGTRAEQMRKPALSLV
ncbi:MAG: hypothetical protein LJE62_08395 [Silicimonas sp.]|jgi:hypothetical protein|nr:hypothetical protein [Silicimonas sp.]